MILLVPEVCSQSLPYLLSEEMGREEQLDFPLPTWLSFVTVIILL